MNLVDEAAGCSYFVAVDPIEFDESLALRSEQEGVGEAIDFVVDLRMKIPGQARHRKRNHGEQTTYHDPATGHH